MAIYEIGIDREKVIRAKEVSFSIFHKKTKERISLTYPEIVKIINEMAKIGIQKSREEEKVIIFEHKTKKIRRAKLEEAIEQYKGAPILIPMNGSAILKKGDNEIRVDSQFPVEVSRKLEQIKAQPLIDMMKVAEKDPCGIILKKCNKIDLKSGLCEVKYRDMDLPLAKALFQANKFGLLQDKMGGKYTIEDISDGMNTGTFQLIPRDTKDGRKTIIIPLKDLTPTQMKILVGLAHTAEDKVNINKKLTESLIFKLWTDCFQKKVRYGT